MKRKQSEGADIVNVTVGKSDFAMPIGGKEALDSKNLGYPPAAG